MRTLCYFIIKTNCIFGGSRRFLNLSYHPNNHSHLAPSIHNRAQAILNYRMPSVQPLIAVFDNARNTRMTDSDCTIDSPAKHRDYSRRRVSPVTIASGAETRITVVRKEGPICSSRVRVHCRPHVRRSSIESITIRMFLRRRNPARSLHEKPAPVAGSRTTATAKNPSCEPPWRPSWRPAGVVAAPTPPRRAPGHPPTRGGWWRQNVAERRAASRGTLRRVAGVPSDVTSAPFRSVTSTTTTTTTTATTTTITTKITPVYVAISGSSHLVLVRHMCDRCGVYRVAPRRVVGVCVVA